MKLTMNEDKLFGFMQQYEYDTDIAIDLLYDKYASFNRALSTRRKQQNMGATISRLNLKLAHRNLKIVPGELKRTYRLTQTG